MFYAAFGHVCQPFYFLILCSVNVNDQNSVPAYGTSIKYSLWNEKHGGSLNGFNEKTDIDEKDPDNFDKNYLDENHKTPQ